MLIALALSRYKYRSESRTRKGVQESCKNDDENYGEWQNLAPAILKSLNRSSQKLLWWLSRWYLGYNPATFCPDRIRSSFARMRDFAPQIV